MSEISAPSTANDALLNAFEHGFDNLAPADQQQIPIADKLAPLRDRILARRTKGFSWKQIAQVLKHPSVGIQVSHATLRRLYGDKPKKTRKQAKRITSIRVLPAPSAAATPPSARP